MKLNNKGFALTSIIYMLIVLFLMILLLILANLAQRKVVLDKIKNDVKTNLNQGGLVAKNTYTVTFDPTIGQVNQTTKQVTYNEPYGELPTPTRDGYKFLGWRGKNLFDKSKYLRLEDYPKYNQTSHYSYNEITLNPNTTYKISVIRHNGFDGTGNGYLLISDNRGINYNYTALAHNSYPNYGGNNNFKYTTRNDGLLYIGLVHTSQEALDRIWENTDVQIEEGTIATSYEPYQEYTSDTIVTRGENHILYAMWEKKESTFITGSEFNAKIKQLAGNTEATYDTDDTNITSIERANALPNFELTNNNVVSTDDSDTPIYAWFDNGTIYYYTEALSLYTNADASRMFQRLKNLTSLNVSTFDTTKTTNMQMMFGILPKIETIDVSNFDTSNVTSMYAMFNFYDVNNISSPSNLRQIILGERFNTNKVTNMRSMFAYCSELESLDLSTFDTTNVTTMYHMFTRVNSITSLDLSTFNMTNVTDTSELIQYMNSLQELKTPKVYPSNSNITFVLPKTMYDSNNNAYTTLGSGSPTETLLKDTQTN